jgi:hypothetical protein
MPPEEISSPDFAESGGKLSSGINMLKGGIEPK